jgi:hypothetical protein
MGEFLWFYFFIANAQKRAIFANIKEGSKAKVCEFYDANINKKVAGTKCF